MFSMLGAYRYLAIALAALLLLAGAYSKGRGDGRAMEASHWQARELEAQQQAARDRFNLQEAIDARNAELAARQQEAADAVETVRVEYLPGKTIVKREVVEKPVFAQCRVGLSVFDTINGALRGTPVAGPPLGGGADGVPGGASPDGG